MNVDTRTAKVVNAAAKGLSQITEGGDRPMYFTDAVIKNTESVYSRVTNGLTATVVDFSRYEGLPAIGLTRRDASRIQRPRA